MERWNRPARGSITTTSTNRSYMAHVWGPLRRETGAIGQRAAPVRSHVCRGACRRDAHCAARPRQMDDASRARLDVKPGRLCPRVRDVVDFGARERSAQVLRDSAGTLVGWRATNSSQSRGFTAESRRHVLFYSGAAMCTEKEPWPLHETMPDRNVAASVGGLRWASSS
jgi:hypothetical protein